MAQEAQRLGQLAEPAHVSLLLLGFQDVIDLLDAEQTHPQCQHADGIACVGPFAGFREFLFGQPESRFEEFDKRRDLNCKHPISSEKRSAESLCRSFGSFNPHENIALKASPRRGFGFPRGESALNSAVLFDGAV
jgi:hypothetical protein